MLPGDKVVCVSVKSGYFGYTGEIILNAGDTIPQGDWPFVDYKEGVFIVRLDFPSPDDHEFLYFSEDELRVIDGKE